MNEKIKWFGRYLNVEVAIQGEEDKGILYGFSNDRYDRIWCQVDSCGEDEMIEDCTLILKELNDISDEDAIECLKLMKIGSEFNIHSKSISGFSYSYIHPRTKRRRNRKMDMFFKSMSLSYYQVDFLRSKGYAIGIPKEYYITEEELS